MSRRWAFYLADMEESCRRIVEFRSTLTREQLEADAMRYDAILRNLELIGEAARNLPDDVRQQAPEIPWKPMITVRNLLAHVYFGVDREIVWNIVETEIPALIVSLSDLRRRAIGDSGVD